MTGARVARWLSRWFAPACGVLAGCVQVLGIHDPIIIGADVDAGSEAGGAIDANDGVVPGDGSTDGITTATRCPTDGGAMIDFGMFCIDAVEVSARAYAAFVVDPVKPPRRSECMWKTAGATSYETVLPGVLELPITNVDWCDAAGYCAWVGKRLCGAVAGPGAPHDLPVEDIDSAMKSEQFAACSDFGQRVFSHGSAAAYEKCNLRNDAGTAVLERSDQRSTCVGSKPGLFALLGNAWEWIDACVKGGPAAEDEVCNFVGGGFNSAPLAACVIAAGGKRNRRSPDVGFRCCY